VLQQALPELLVGKGGSVALRHRLQGQGSDGVVLLLRSARGGWCCGFSLWGRVRVLLVSSD
jgi:hypothetical protein